MNDKLIKHGLSKLLSHQINVLQECLKKTSGGLALVMGYGKSILSIVLALIYRNRCKINLPLPEEIVDIITSYNKIAKQTPILVVVSKTLILPWSQEIKKFFGSLLKHQIYYKKSDNFVLKNDTELVLTTPQIMVKYYKKYGLAQKIIDINENNKPLNEPILVENENILYSIKWSCLIIDEIQKLTNILTHSCQAITSISAYHKWGLSGTMFDEPVAKRILGYYKMLSLPFEPTTIPSTKKYIRSGFKGFQETIVERSTNEAFIDPIINKKIIEHSLTTMEQYIYTSLLYTLNKLIKIKKVIANDDGTIELDLEDKNMLKGSVLVFLGYLRKCLISPYNVAVNIMASSEIVSETFNDVVKKLNEDIGSSFKDYVKDISNEKSNRITKVIETLSQHSDEKVIVFSCFRVTQDLLNKYIKNRPILSLESHMSIEKRFDIIENFKNSSNAILFLTYSIGAEGLNLQCSHTILLVDFWWSCGRSNQAIARILRYGQESPVVNIYFFTANTGIEQGLFFKHEDKLSVLDELLVGPKKSRIRSLKTEEIIKLLINSDENKMLLKKINKIKN